MLEDSAHKLDEQHPLLMVSGAGDATAERQPPPVIDPLLWSTTVAPRRPWSERWPEYLSTCWMTFILLGISFLVFYAVGMVVVYKHEAYILVKCNENKPASDVFYHEIIPRGGAFPLSNYANYLANVATLYPNLRFYVYFFIDDSTPSQNSFLEKLYPSNFYEEYNANNKREVRNFQKKYSNVNITVMPLSKYMAATPLKYKWRSIPTPYIPFYARVFAVYINGGVGLDLAVHNEQYNDMLNPQHFDRKVKAILKQHNDGISPEKYLDTINSLAREDDAEFFSSLICMIQKIFNETLTMFNKPFTSISPADNSSKKPMRYIIPQVSDSKTLVRTHRSKREALHVKQENQTGPVNDTSLSPVINIILANATIVNVTGDSDRKNVYQFSAYEPNINAELEKKASDPDLVMDKSGWHFRKVPNQSDPFEGSDFNPESDRNKKYNKVVLFYDFSLISEPIRSDAYSKNRKSSAEPLKILTIGAEGSFVTSTMRMHPILGAILSAGCKRLSPKFAIENALITRCSDPFKDESFCSSVYLL